MKNFTSGSLFFYSVAVLLLISCNNQDSGQSKEAIARLNLKRGEIISCGPSDKQFGTVNFEITGSDKVKIDFNLAIELLHSFEYDESEKVFAKLLMKSHNAPWHIGE